MAATTCTRPGCENEVASGGYCSTYCANRHLPYECEACGDTWREHPAVMLVEPACPSCGSSRVRERAAPEE